MTPIATDQRDSAIRARYKDQTYECPRMDTDSDGYPFHHCPGLEIPLTLRIQERTLCGWHLKESGYDELGVSQYKLRVYYIYNFGAVPCHTDSMARSCEDWPTTEITFRFANSGCICEIRTVEDVYTMRYAHEPVRYYRLEQCGE